MRHQLETGRYLASIICLIGFITGQVMAQEKSPDPPVCTVDQNIQPLLKLNVDKVEYAKGVLPSMRAIIQAHTAALTTYQVPFKTVWAATGLSQLFPRGISGCCEACSANLCASDFVFTKIVGADMSYASFNWQMKNSPPSGQTLTYTAGVVDATFVLPTHLEGRAAIGPDYIVLQFEGVLPSFKLVDKNYQNTGTATTTFDDRVLCTGTLAQWAVLRPRTSANVIPHLDFFIEPK